MSDRLLVVSTTAFCLIYYSYLGEVLVQPVIPYPSLDKNSRLIRSKRPIQM